MTEPRSPLPSIPLSSNSLFQISFQISTMDSAGKYLHLVEAAGVRDLLFILNFKMPAINVTK